MSMTKEAIERQDEYRVYAIAALKEIGAIETCDLHSDFLCKTYKYDDVESTEKAIAKVQKESSEEIDVERLSLQIGNVLSEASDSKDECPKCYKTARE